MGSTVHDYTYAVQVKSRFDLFAKDDFNVEDSSKIVKPRTEKRDRRPSGKVPEKVNAKETGSQKERRGDAKKTEQNPAETSKKDRPQRGKSGSSLVRMDRHSGSDKTGVKAVMKRDGFGMANWGTMEDELEAQTEEIIVDQSTEEKETTEESAAQPPVEEQPKTYTLKEYKEMKKKANVTLASSKVRRPNDGKNVFSDMVVLHNSQPVETKIEVILEDPKEAEEEAKKPTFFVFGRGGTGNSSRPFSRGGPRGGRGSRGGSRNDQPSDRKSVEHHDEPIAEEQKEAPEETANEKEVDQPSTDRRGRGRGGESGRPFRGRGSGGRGGFSSDRGGRGGFSSDRGGRGGFSSDRGGRGGFSSDRGGRGGFSSDRGGRGRGGSTQNGDRPYRGGARGSARGAGGPRGGFSAGERGGRPDGGRGGFRRGGRGGGFDHPSEGALRGNHNQQNAAPRMDSDADFPALK
nr:mRNA binding protein [Hymenolepis microstoma]